MRLFAALFVIVKDGKQPKCPSTGNSSGNLANPGGE